MNDYYKRRTEMDFLEDELRSMQGCQKAFGITLIVFAIVGLVLLSLILR